MSKISQAFASGKAFIPFITCGDPDMETTIKVVKAAADAGADLIELGIPFSDPVAEGPAIQSANIRALKNRITTDDVFDLVKKMRDEVSVPFVFMTYANVVFSYGPDAFFERCREDGVEGVILPDVPFEEKEEFESVALRHGVELLSLISPTSNQRIVKIAREARGFVYVVSSLGVTGTREQISSDISEMVRLVRENTDIPCAVGFGISTPEQAWQMASLSDGAIVGSAIIKLIEQHGRDAAPYVGEYVKSMKEAVRRADTDPAPAPSSAS
ncbi:MULTISPECIES: tryptophan synthase subunit alpha [unclassified Anaerobiospirillum]|uniref:tryptophan synthase subunit alpha n=1 Tax=unclassified Anaerobiospirillum TaxID=2647410 RepID=UPI001FF5ABA9|nr:MULTISPECIES: tryptophan synthase subunit alpha [unclassified Anaerobiospirillum]MCK0534910.1 tryptophan synthase subunit alpha [Anaerobiospirillum sp. NML120511]MCK0540092.1 tryptophan synthase subunit alpha [Anaerobiospirillum sp. NML02-A-032]